MFARLFEHGKMRAASERQRGECNRFINSNPLPALGPHLECVLHLQVVADAFVESQQLRHTADYDNATRWTRTDVLTQITLVEDAFQSWRAIRDEPTAQAYLFSMLGRSPGRA